MTSTKLTRVLAWVSTLVVACTLAKWPGIQNALHPYFFGSLVEGRQWLSNQGWHRTAGYYGLVVVHGSELAIALIVGLVCALVLGKQGIFLVAFFVLAFKTSEGALAIGADGATYTLAELLQIELISTCIVLPAGLAGAFLGLGVRKYLSKEGQRSQCRSCRYDLTGNTSGVCPECGTGIAC